MNETKMMLSDTHVVDELRGDGITRGRDIKDITLGLFDLVQHHQMEMDAEQIELNEKQFVKSIFCQRNDLSGKACWRSTTTTGPQLSQLRTRMKYDFNKLDATLDDLKDLLEKVHVRGPMTRPPSQEAKDVVPSLQREGDADAKITGNP